MMRYSALILGVVSGILLSDSLVYANSFHRDVVSNVAKKERHQLPMIGGKKNRSERMQSELLEKAIPLSEYNAQLKSLGVELPTAASEGADAGQSRRMEEADDYYMNEQNMYSFSGYSMKYAKCQPIQQFSEDALLAGEYSPMVTQDIVILRLCPYKSCSSSRQYGCHYNYAEYAIGLYDYIRIMLRYKADKQENLCEWCANCINRRQLEEENGQEQQGEANGDDGQNGGNNNGDDAQNGDDYYRYDGEDDAYQNNNDDGAYYDENDECYMYGSYCENYYYDCDVEDQQQNQQNYYQDDYYYNLQQKYIAEEEYFDYLGCTEIADSYGGVYFVRPTCDTSEEKIKMSVYYDEYCSQSASQTVNMDNFEVAFDETVFEELNEGSCFDCSESNYPPGFNSNSYMCNMIHDTAADCTTNMIYDLFDGQQSDSTECSFIESIRFGTYDSNGEIAVEAGEDAEEVVTDLQKLGLVASAFICAIFVVYACYLHHSMTNLLIKSLSHRELLPPSRHSRRRSPGRPKRRRSKGSSKGSRRGDDEDDEWDRSKPLRSPV